MLGNNGGNKKFVTIVGGQWTLRVPEGTEGAVERELTKGDKKGEIVHELQFDTVDGFIRSGGFKTGSYGTDVELVLEDDGEIFNVQISVPDAGDKNDIFAGFGKFCPNIDPSKKLLLGLGKDSKTGYPYLFVKSGGDTVHAAFTKDNPNGMPQWEKKEVMGKVKWNADAQNEFLYQQIIDFFGTVEDSAPVVSDDEPF